MNIISNLSIRNKLLLISLVPVGALFYFLAESVIEDLERKNALENVYSEVLTVEAMANLLHQITQERGHSLEYMATGGREGKGELLRQRQETDKAATALRDQLRKSGQDAELSFLEGLQTIRAGVTAARSEVDSVGNAFIDVHAQISQRATSVLIGAADAEITRQMEAHLFLSYTKRFLSELRARVYVGMLKGGFEPAEFAMAASARGKYEMNLEQFSNYAAPALAAELGKIRGDRAFAQAAAMSNTIFSNIAGLTQVPTEEWREVVTTLLNSIKSLEDLSSTMIREAAAAKQEQTVAALTRNLVVAVIIIAGMILLLYIVIRDIVNSVMSIKTAANRISLGESEFSVPVNSRDEIGQLAYAFNQLIEVTREYSGAAAAIGNGDYSVDVKVRSGQDTLGLALNDMKNNLRQLAAENERRTWLLTGNGELNDKIRGEKDLKELAQEVVSKLTEYMGAQIGAIYLAENGHLALVGSYAFHYRKDNSNLISYGQGLVGQAALEKKSIIFNPVPDDYVKINSGLGSSSPRNIVVYPFLYEGELKGVIEIGSVTEFTEQHMQFLGLVAENIGIAFNTAQSRAQLKELLEETQRQAEEMEAQQEELRQINEELQEKTQLLEKSEAELKAQQEELQQTNEELEEKANLLEEQKEKLEVAKMEVETKARELEVTSKYKSEFLANMSHELRTPLNSILILAQILSENKNRSLGDKEVEFARNIYSSGTDLLNLINEILDLSKVEAGRIELDIDEVDMASLTQDIRSMFQEVAASKSIGFQINFDPESFDTPVMSDAQRLSQILRNLLSNAFKFTEAGGSVNLDIRKTKGTGVRHEELILFRVQDTGIGIPEDKLGIVFEAFQQADGSTKRKFGGTGLGLSISRELAHALGGEIHVESEEGKGSIFSLYLPLQFDPSRLPATEKKILVKPKEEKKLPLPAVPLPAEATGIPDDRYVITEGEKVILIIEDDEPFASVVLDFVRSRGYRGIVALQGNTGLSLARHYRPDAIILDMKLPVMDGSEVLKQLKADPNLRHIPVQIISSYDHRKEGFELGAFDVLKKPLSKNELDSAFGRIEEFLNRKLKRLLIVEDDKTQSKAIKELIGNGDVKSSTAYSGAEAYDLMQKEKFDCVIIDLGLPDMTGFELMEKIKANAALNKTPLIVYTAKDLTKAEASKLEKLANTVVLKTVNSNERLLDETILFLHKVESKLPAEKQQIIRSLHRTEEVLRNKKILIVDDDMRNIYSLTNALEEEGVRCITAENGRAAIETLQEHADTDIILMDVMMPEMDGLEATREIRKKTRFAKLPIIALTAKAMKGDREKCLEAGMSDYISKPVNVEQLLSLMRVWLYK